MLTRYEKYSPLEQARRSFEVRYFSKHYEMAHGVISAMVKPTGMSSAAAVRRKLKDLGIIKRDAD